MAAAKKTPAAVKKTPAKKAPVKKAAPKPKADPTPAELEDLVFEDLIWRYTKHQDWDRVEDIFDLYGHLLQDRGDEQS